MSAAQNVRNLYSRSLHLVNLFSALPSELVRELETKLVISEHKAGSVLYRQDEKAKGVFILFRGRIKLSAIVVGERTALLKIASPVEVLGVAAVLSSHLQITNAESLTSSVTGFLQSDEIATAVRNYPEFASAVAHQLARECMHTMGETLLLRVPSSSAQRLAAMLLRVSELANHSPTSECGKVGYTHAELGQLIGASRETVTRTLKQFERKGLVSSNEIAGADFETLRELADGI